MEEKKKSELAISSIGFTDLLFLVFLVLKLCDVIAWSWWWVFAPLWMPVAIVVAAVVIAVAIYGIVVGVLSLYVCITNIYDWIKRRRYGKTL